MWEVEKLRAYLKTGRFTVDLSVDVGEWNRKLMDALEERGEDKQSLSLEQEWFSEGVIEQRVCAIREGIHQYFGVEETDVLVMAAFRLALGLPVPDLSIVRGRRLERLWKEVILNHDPGIKIERVPRYCQEVRLVVDGKLGVLGQIFLQLTGREAVRFLLAIEICQSQGRWDLWRLDQETAKWMLQVTKEEWRHNSLDNDDQPNLNEPKIERLADWKLIFYGTETDGHSTSWYLLDFGTRLLTELVEDKNPYISLVQSILSDEIGTTVGQVSRRPMQGGATEATIRQAKLIAHELRNALLPVQYAWGKTWKYLEGTDAGMDLEPQRKQIEAGLAQALDFAAQNAQNANLLPNMGETFAVGAAIADAIIDYNVHVDRETDQDIVIGQRARFSLVIVNLLRNARQIKSDAALRVALTRLGSKVQVFIDDDGPSVPEELRRRIFDNGITLRPDGTGHGLAFARQVVEVEMKGTISCSISPQKGARFTIRLPAAGV